MYTHRDLNKNVNAFDAKNILKTKNDDIDEILRGEISAVDAYDQVMDKIKNDPEAYRLKQFKLDHENAITFWKKQAQLTGSVPESSSKIWGTVVEAFVGLSKLIGEQSALSALKKGEEHGLSIYQRMLLSEKITNYHKKEIRNTFIPRQKRHIESINTLIELK